MLLINSYEFYLNILFISLFLIIGLMDDKFELRLQQKLFNAFYNNIVCKFNKLWCC